jgi:DNA mismatch repair protein MutL
VGQIRILSEQIANKIAAGEVIERPASVVKELLENALDAQAGAISVSIGHGGRSLIKVSDDGCGMDPEDARNCLLRHATSKISNIEDIERIQTLGFRGEALPSIAAVSRLSLITRQHDAQTGTSIRANGGAIESVKESVASPGAAIEVADLFFNTPARKKFLKSEGAEYAAIADVFDTTALCFPGVSFCLYKTGIEVARYAASEKLLGRIEQIYDEAFAQHLHPIHLAKEAVTIDGFVGTPDNTRINRSGQKFFINHRPVRLLPLNWALDRAYEEFKERDRFPVAVLFIDIEPSAIDVNVHPAKREVRLLNERFVQDILIKAIKKTFVEKGIFPRTTFQIPAGISSSDTYYSGNSQIPSFAEIREAAAAWKAPAPVMPESALFTRNEALTAPPAQQAATAAEANPFGITRILGQIQGTYLVAETHDGIALIDQHAAHERIVYEEILGVLQRSAAPSQRLLLPLTMHLDLKEQSTMESCLPDFLRIGFGINDLGGGTFAIDAVPIFLTEENCARMLQDTLHELMEEMLTQAKEQREKTIGAALACKTRTVKAGQRLDELEMLHLVQRLGSTQNPHTCPHGRPTIITMTIEEIEKRFKRR